MYPNYLFYCFKWVCGVCPNLSSAPCKMQLPLTIFLKNRSPFFPHPPPSLLQLSTLSNFMSTGLGGRQWPLSQHRVYVLATLNGYLCGKWVSVLIPSVPHPYPPPPTHSPSQRTFHVRPVFFFGGIYVCTCMCCMQRLFNYIDDSASINLLLAPFEV